MDFKHIEEKMNKTIRDLVAINNYSYVPLSYYYYLFCLIGNISVSDLLENSFKIYNIIESFFSKIRNENLVNEQIISILNFSIQKIFFYVIILGESIKWLKNSRKYR